MHMPFNELLHLQLVELDAAVILANHDVHVHSTLKCLNYSYLVSQTQMLSAYISTMVHHMSNIPIAGCEQY